MTSTTQWNPPCENQLECKKKKKNYVKLFETSLYKVTYEYRQCKECGLIYHSPEPEVDPQDIYNELEDNTGEEFSGQEETKRHTYGRLADKYLDEIKAKVPKVLDLGCSQGWLLEEFKTRGFKVYGIDPNPIATKEAKQNLPPEQIHTGTIEDSPFPDNQFDLVICHQTLEHLPNPFETLLWIQDRLHKNGILRLTTPNFNGFSFHILQEQWQNTKPINHCSMFTPEALKHFVKEASLQVENLNIDGFSYHRRRNENGVYKKHLSGLWGGCFHVLHSLVVRTGWGDNITMVARK